MPSRSSLVEVAASSQRIRVPLPMGATVETSRQRRRQYPDHAARPGGRHMRHITAAPCSKLNVAA